MSRWSELRVPIAGTDRTVAARARYLDRTVYFQLLGVPATSSGLDLDLLREVSARRRDRWHTPDTVPWLGVDWSNAMGGECGEAQNVVKKIRRLETGTGGGDGHDLAVLIEMLADELADTIAYADLLAAYYGIDLSDAIARKFNAISEREGFPDRLPRRTEMGGGRVAEQSEPHRVSPAPTGDAGSRERLDPLAATPPLGLLDRLLAFCAFGPDVFWRRP